eukprot:Phypoly_transcript_20082.p1 GENE.Phypoly_transcript_20082~~Phypoly_transcript_20082.p1  ORF type:complete len:140 (+),score=10.86 Phypoly_transcript_20082:271-690(+)
MVCTIWPNFELTIYVNLKGIKHQFCGLLFILLNRPPILHVTQRTPLSYLLTTNIMGEWSGGGKGGHSLVYLWPKDSIVDRPAFNSFLLYLFEKNCAGVVEIDHASKMYLMPPCDATYQMYGSKSKGSLYVLVATDKNKE